jgi:ActR/RegA family two-component response regulator
MESRYPLSPRNVLFVFDDDEAIERLVSSACARKGWEVWLADSGPEAIRLLRNRAPATTVVLAESPVAETDGSQLLPLLQKLMPETRCCLLTARSADEPVGDGLAFVLARPSDLADLSRTCANLRSNRGPAASSPATRKTPPPWGPR